MASTKASVETVKSSVEAVGRVVEDMQKNEAEGIEELKRTVEEASSCLPEKFRELVRVTFVLICHAASRAHRGPAVSETRDDQKGVRRREDSAEAGCIARGTPSVLHRVAD